MSGDENNFSEDQEKKRSIPDDKCSVYCSSWKPRTSALLRVLDCSLSWAGLMNPPLKSSGSDWSSWWLGSLWHGPVLCHRQYTYSVKYMFWGVLNTQSIKKYPRLGNKSKMCVFSYILQAPCEFSIISVTAGTGRTLFPKTCPRTTDVVLHMFSACRMMSSDIRFGHRWWFLWFDSSGTHTLWRDTECNSFKGKLEICITKDRGR